jgi:hypothetical protein
MYRSRRFGLTTKALAGCTGLLLTSRVSLAESHTPQASLVGANTLARGLLCMGLTRNKRSLYDKLRHNKFAKFFSYRRPARLGLFPVAEVEK